MNATSRTKVNLIFLPHRPSSLKRLFLSPCQRVYLWGGPCRCQCNPNLYILHPHCHFHFTPILSDHSRVSFVIQTFTKKSHDALKSPQILSVESRKPKNKPPRSPKLTLELPSPVNTKSTLPDVHSSENRQRPRSAYIPGSSDHRCGIRRTLELKMHCG